MLIPSTTVKYLHKIFYCKNKIKKIYHLKILATRKDKKKSIQISNSINLLIHKIIFRFHYAYTSSIMLKDQLFIYTILTITLYNTLIVII